MPTRPRALEKKGAAEHFTDSLATGHSSSNGSRIQKGKCRLGIFTLTMKGTHKSGYRRFALTVM